MRTALLLPGILLALGCTREARAPHEPPVPSPALAVDVPTKAAKADFIGGHLKLTLPSELAPAEMPPEIKASLSDLSDLAWRANASSTFRMLAHSGGYMRRADLPGLCKSSPDELAPPGSSILQQSMIDLSGIPFCQVITVTSGIVTRQLIGSIEGRTATLAFYFREAERSIYEPAIDAALRTIEHQATQADSACDESAAARCVDDQRMADCHEGRWRVRSCDEMCKDMGGSAEGCTGLEETKPIVCLCNHAEPSRTEN